MGAGSRRHILVRKPIAEIIASLHPVTYLFWWVHDAVMLIGYVRVLKSDGSQTSQPRRDGLLAAGVDVRTPGRDQPRSTIT